MAKRDALRELEAILAKVPPEVAIVPPMSRSLLEAVVQELERLRRTVADREPEHRIKAE